ncbi:hypothetical protein DV706_16165 (plasmid) [Natronorubrum bangense]|uniref:Uncharacterized protein n=2 Tax=Natronorubrum bangense TaxID=61858 RepID=A0A4D6HHH9_9EURY|nr:DUF5791 family protein [Natronorubrum bangense]QCC53200.1 hypothetical protein DV706_01105 [Natronorubrum bangense]QCC56107.1 hypothetical protein DV706_16165 [Natronorubrum bangense]
MFYEQRMTVPDSPAALRTAYEADLRSVIDQYGPDEIANRTEIDAETASALLEGESPELTLEAVAQIQALEDGEPDADELVMIACEHLLLGMSTAVLDVDAIETELELDLDAKEIQQKIERRAPMSFEEFVHIQYVIADGAP